MQNEFTTKTQDDKNLCESLRPLCLCGEKPAARNPQLAAT